MEAVLVEAGHPDVPTVGPCGVEQTKDPRAEPTRSSGLPHASYALGSGGVAEAEQQRCRVTTGSQGLKPGDHAHKAGLRLVVGISPNVGRNRVRTADSTIFFLLLFYYTTGTVL